MNFEAAEAVARAVLYEGYLLYPYRSSAIKNHCRWNFGTLHPRFRADASHGERWRARVQCLVRAGDGARLTLKGRFLRLSIPDGAQNDAGRHRAEEQAAVESFEISRLSPELLGVPFKIEERSERIGGVEHRLRAIEGALEVAAEPAGPGLRRITAAIENLTPAQAGELLSAGALLSAHLLLGVEGGKFLSLLDYPEELRAAAEGCRGEGLWPSLIGGARESDVLLASPVILGDDPKVAPESPGDLFDASEIDEILSLRVLALADAEKEEIRSGDPRARALLERVESLGAEGWARLHGTRRRP